MREWKVGLVGCGHISVAHLRGWQKAPNATVAGVLDVNRTLAEDRAAAFRVPKIYDELETLIEECDIVDVCTPPQSHAELARCVLAAGKYLVIEKPLVTDVGDWRELKALAAQSGGRIAVVHNLKFARAVQQAKLWIDDGRIGEILGMTREFLTSPASDRMLVGEGHWSHALPGGRWFETLPHELYLIHYFIGSMEVADVTAVRLPNAAPTTPADEVLITMRSDRSIATIRYSASCQLNKRLLSIHGTEGEIIVDILSDAAILTRTVDQRWRRALGLVYSRSGQALVRMLIDRAQYVSERRAGENPHSRLIRAVARNAAGLEADPTPLDEIDYVVTQCDLIGRAIDACVDVHASVA